MMSVHDALRRWLLPGAAPAAALPRRVQQEVEREQFRAELLVTVVQLLLVGLLALLYRAVPQGFSPGAPIEAAPLGLSLFALLALLRLYAAWTGQLSRPVLAAGVIAETAVLLFVIWAYHLQYEQPPQFSLKSSEFVYLFVLVALRALRFEPAWVLLSGGSAALGWLALLGWTLHAAESNPLTWDVVTSMRSTQLHLGAELDKVLALVVITGTLALALARARHLLRHAVAQQRAVADLSQFFDGPVARRITGSEAEAMPGQGELRDAAIVFFDLRGFTQAAARLTPAELLALLGEYQRLVVPRVHAHGGSIDKFMGDGILASFGAVAADAAPAANALAAVDAVLRAVDGWRAQRAAGGAVAPDVGAGVATGRVLFGIIGDGQRLEYTVIGDAVNLAAKLEKHNKAERTRALATRAAYEQARAQGYAGVKPLREARTVGGVAAPLDLAVLDAGQAASSTPSAA
ncbi:adenylate/guanylate cyclase domain-containing protein [Aquabacterium humicola]|uniref:adenylate/guanylate cyclase domain-containing protein n=1 Tax=Aquabacterium humicola TaxID=3237377 RepID=UPI0025438B52|nr:adenylate/guanylate cyclase domain-containing protein [Rubrivivax pictus]